MLAWHLPINLNFFHRPKPDLMHLFLAGVARRVGVALLTLFSPIYIYQVTQGLGLAKSTSVILVLAYFFLILTTKLITFSISEDLSRKIGFKGIIWLSGIPFLVFIVSLVFASSYPYLFLLAAISWGIHAGFFWWGYHGYFIKTEDSEHFGQGVGEANFLETIASVLAPIVGALITTYFGFNTLFIFSGLFMIAGLLLLGKDHDKRQRRDIKFKEVLGLIRTHKSISLAYMGSSAESVLYSTIWPLFLFLFFGQVISLGAIVSVAALVASIFSIAVGDWVDRQGERTIIALGAPLSALSWILRILNKSFPVFIIADSLENFGQRMVNLPLNALTYKKALEAESAKAILFRETTMIMGALLVLLILIGWIYFGGNLTGGFVLAAIFSTFPLVAIFKKRIHDK
ncbi:MFS transporter [Patescibacteria group bacterium]|nr:MFS transporter [Patescibacteria group bacterium]